MLYWKILLQVLAVVVGLLVNRLDYDARDKRTRKFRVTRRSLLSLSIFFLIVGIVVVVADEFAKQKEIAEVTGRLVALQQQGEVAKNLVTGGIAMVF